MRLLTAPFKMYNHFMQPVALAIMSQCLKENGIPHSLDDLHVKLYHAQKNCVIDLSNLDVKEWDRYISGEDVSGVEKAISRIAELTTFTEGDLLLFSATPPPGEDIPHRTLILALFRYLKKKYKPTIITNNHMFHEPGLVDETLWSLNELYKYLQKNGFPLRHTANTTQNLDGLQLELYRYQGLIVAGYHFFEGCGKNCHFCDGYFRDQSTLRLPDTNAICEGIISLSNKYGIRNFMFLNTTINPTEAFARGIAQGLTGHGIKWCDCANFDGMTEGLLDTLKASGCVKLVFGLETTSKKLQARINKEIDLKHAEAMLRHCHKIGIWADVTLLCGLPYEGYSDLHETLVFLRENLLYLRGINLNRFMMKINDYYHHPDKHEIEIVNGNTDYTQIGFNEINGLKWPEKWKYTEKVYQEIIAALDPVRVDYLRPVHHIFRVLSNNTSIENINKYIDNKVLSNKTEKLDRLIEKYRQMSEAAD